ncbi:MAG: hypothetical protein HZC36_13935 [Armatimonadetes bacterium]|nr:hypothetical protein [Armatimonadota bacterium]
MNAPLLCWILLTFQGGAPQALLDDLRLSIDSGQPEKLQKLFVRQADAESVLEMAGRSGPKSLKVKLIPTPPGWGAPGSYWAIFHKRQGIESFHDMVFNVAVTPERLLVGREVPETQTGGWTVETGRFDVKVLPSQSAAEVETTLRLTHKGEPRALMMRLGDPFTVSSASSASRAIKVVEAYDRAVPTPAQGDLVRAGGILVYWGTSAPNTLTLRYRGNPGEAGNQGGDRVTNRLCYLTAWWTPTIARQPYTTATRIEAPEPWVIVSEGVEAQPEAVGFAAMTASPGNSVRTFKCDIKITFPKVIGGEYKLAAEGKDGKGRVFRSYQLEPINRARADKDVDLMKRATAFYEDTLGPWPFPGYACFDGEGYYGIESYSYTILLTQNTTRFVAHEMGHTYFGGIVPNSYTRDCWNESLTQYVESVLFSKNADKSLEKGYETNKIPVPMTAMSRPGLFGSASYFRGAYVMTMLGHEIGLDRVIAGMKAIVKERAGVDTTWPELRPYFEKASGQDLGWFWDQWVENAVYPKVDIADAQLIQGNPTTTWVTLVQSGTKKPYRLRLKIKASAQGAEKVTEVVLSEVKGTFRVDTPFVPTKVELDPFEFTMATVGPAVEPKK